MKSNRWKIFIDSKNEYCFANIIPTHEEKISKWKSDIYEVNTLIV